MKTNDFSRNITKIPKLIPFFYSSVPECEGSYWQWKTLLLFSENATNWLLERTPDFHNPNPLSDFRLIEIQNKIEKHTL